MQDAALPVELVIVCHDWGSMVMAMVQKYRVVIGIIDGRSKGNKLAEITEFFMKVWHRWRYCVGLSRCSCISGTSYFRLWTGGTSVRVWQQIGITWN